MNCLRKDVGLVNLGVSAVEVAGMHFYTTNVYIKKKTFASSKRDVNR